MSHILRALVFLVTLGGCSAGPAAIERASSSSASLNASAYPALQLRQGPVLYFDYSNLISMAGRGGYGTSFHIDVAVENLAYEKQVGIVWTSTGWVGDTETCPLAYEQPLDDGMELWGSNCANAIPPEGGTYFAAFATMNGTTYWDNNDGANYTLGWIGTAMLASPERGVSISDQGVVSATHVASGLAAVWPYAGAKEVTVVYSVDGWATTNTSAATEAADGAWSWSIPLTAPSGAVLSYAVSYSVAEVTFWANNGGHDYEDAIP